MRALSTRRCERSRAYDAHPTDVKGGEAPNKRLKLPGGDRSKGRQVLCPSVRQLTLNMMTPCGRVARSLSAIR